MFIAPAAKITKPTKGLRSVRLGRRRMKLTGDTKKRNNDGKRKGIASYHDEVIFECRKAI